MQFQDLKLGLPIQKVLAEEGYSTPTPIQEKAIPVVLSGRDLVGLAQTGTGKTAAFGLPLLERLAERKAQAAGSGDGSASGGLHPRPKGTGRIAPYSFRALILAPTRELAAQVSESLLRYGSGLPLKGTAIFGGVGEMPQKDKLRGGLDWLVATPGRLMDLAGQGAVRFDQVEFLVLDEADRMLDMGFIPQIRQILKALPRDRQTLLFSATMPEEIRSIAKSFLRDPAQVAIAPESPAVERISQSVYAVQKPEKPDLLVRLLLEEDCGRTVVFTRTKHGADKVCKFLVKSHIPAEALHGNKSQGARTRALDGFKNGSIRVLVATDIAARGIDVDEVTHVVNFDLPEVPETYVHRIGRTARAGASGVAFSFCSAEERDYLLQIERLTRRRIPSGTFRAGRAGGNGSVPSASPVSHRAPVSPVSPVPSKIPYEAPSPARPRPAPSAPARQAAPKEGPVQPAVREEPGFGRRPSKPSHPQGRRHG